jgi:SAM-dependent methyltransferase
MSPMANSYLTEEQLHQMEPFYPLHVYVCDSCFLVQLPVCQSPQEIFCDYAYFSSYSQSWLDHAREYVESMLTRFHFDSNKRVVEIASNDGYLLQYFRQKGIPVLGIEPAANVAKAAQDAGIPTMVKFFGVETAAEMKTDGLFADLIVANNVLAHVPDLNDFVRGLKMILKPEGVLTLEFPHLWRLMDEYQYDTIYHEHFSYFSFITVQKVFAAHDLRVFDVDEIPTHGGSLRVYVCHVADESKPNHDRVAKLDTREKAAGFDSIEHYLGFKDKVKSVSLSILEFMVQAKKQGKSLAGYGAPAKGNTLLNYCGIGTDYIDYTVDRSPHKQNHFLPGTHIPIYHPDKVKETRPDYLVILPWNLKTEIMEQMAYIGDWNGQFVTLIPEVNISG